MNHPTTADHAHVAKRAGLLLNQGYHCSEAVLLAVGDHMLGHVDEQAIQLSSGFAGGIGSSRLDACGALTGGVMAIGALHGRAQPDADDTLCRALAAKYREQFVQAFGTTCCGELRPCFESCSILVERASRILLDLIDEQK